MNRFEVAGHRGFSVFTLAQVLDARRGGTAKHKRAVMFRPFRFNNVYIVRDIDSILYVGSTYFGADTRLRQHIYKKTALGLAIRSLSPISDLWTVEIRSYPSIEMARSEESRLIKLLRPRFSRR